MHLIDADELEKDGWMMHRIVRVDKNTMSYQTKKPTDFPTIEPESNCFGCKHLGMWEDEVEYGYPSPCTRCKRRANDNYER